MKKSPKKPAKPSQVDRLRGALQSQVPSVGERFEQLSDSIRTLALAIRPDEDSDQVILDELEIRAVKSLIAGAENEVWWLQRSLEAMPGPMMDAPAPTDDQRSALETAGAR